MSAHHITSQSHITLDDPNQGSIKKGTTATSAFVIKLNIQPKFILQYLHVKAVDAKNTRALQMKKNNQERNLKNKCMSLNLNSIYHSYKHIVQHITH